MNDFDFSTKKGAKVCRILLLGCLCLVGSVFKSVAGEADSTRVAEWKISGRVIDEQGEPVIGALVLEKGTTNGNVTDTLGNYKITVKAGATIQVSFIGYVTREIVLKREGGTECPAASGKRGVG